ncbi:ABC transporter permease [Rhodospirillum centenum]|uniref:Glutamate/aspartate import permease protein GltK n=1 Tax=Rhodospirillum centenum (strain ATCC 51521 / SW) TaxID=414684 RepID=B6IV03_RHOCS|nr:ABC transporter permease [Rhodospirillum centenum]ACJ00085.1 amino acid ABC transporter, permease protein [Rhodospirillum centenum SW]
MDLNLILESLPQLLSGTVVTVELVALSLVLGLVLAVGIAVLRLSGIRAVSMLAGGYTFLFRSTPLLVQIFLIYYGLGQFETVRESILWPFLREPYWCAILALTLNTAAYTGEIIRGGIRAVPFGQIEAARAVGMSGRLLFRRIVLPQAFRQALPAYGNEMIQMVQASSLASTITLMELTGAARAIASRTFQPVEVFVIAGALYLAMNYALTRIVRAAEARLAHERR